jgi:hypothetical protein
MVNATTTTKTNKVHKTNKTKSIAFQRNQLLSQIKSQHKIRSNASRIEPGTVVVSETKTVYKSTNNLFLLQWKSDGDFKMLKYGRKDGRKNGSVGYWQH